MPVTPIARRRASVPSARRCAGAVASLLALGLAAGAEAHAATTVRASADAYVSAATPQQAYGGSTALAVDGSPEVVSYLRFETGAPAGATVRGTLEVYAGKPSATGLEVRRATGDGWDEHALTHATRPALGTVVGRSAPFDRGQWVPAPVAAVAGEGGAVTLALVTDGAADQMLSSREAAGDVRAPRLVVETIEATPAEPVPAEPEPPAVEPAPEAAPDAPGTTVTRSADADAYVSSSKPRQSFGTSTALAVDGRPDMTTYLRFDAGDPAAPVVRATLQVWSAKASGGGFSVHRVRDRWDEGVTYATRPAIGDAVVARSGAYGSREWVTVDVTDAVTDGTVDLALVSGAAADQRMSSRESTETRAPRLVVETAAQPAPAPEPAPVEEAEPAPELDPAPDFDPPLVDDLGAFVPYDARSPWNTPIGADPALDPRSATYVTAVADNGLPLTADVDQYTIPVYRVDADTPRRSIVMSGYFSSYDAGDDSRVGHGFAPTIHDVPVPDAAVASAGSDGQIVLWDPTSGVEYAFWQFARAADGTLTATNGYRYHTTAGYLGRFADGKAGRGAGLPYSAGLVRRWELERGRIDHALAFAYDDPSSAFVYPASKSDGGRRGGTLGVDPPEGARFQLDPSLTEADFDAWGLSPEAKTIARALQIYGMYLVDHSGSTKLYVEARETAGWPAHIDRDLTAGIPLDRFRVVAPPAAP